MSWLDYTYCTVKLYSITLAIIHSSKTCIETGWRRMNCYYSEYLLTCKVGRILLRELHIACFSLIHARFKPLPPRCLPCWRAVKRRETRVHQTRTVNQMVQKRRRQPHKTVRVKCHQWTERYGLFIETAMIVQHLQICVTTLHHSDIVLKMPHYRPL